MRDARDRQAELGLGIVDRVAAEHGDARLRGDVGAAREDRGEHFGAELLEREATRFSAVSGRAPIAYTSDSAFAAAMRPKS